MHGVPGHARPARDHVDGDDTVPDQVAKGESGTDAGSGPVPVDGGLLRHPDRTRLDLRSVAPRRLPAVPGRDVRGPVRRCGPPVGAAADRGRGDGAATAGELLGPGSGRPVHL